MPKYDASEISEIVEMLSFQNLDVRSVTLGISLLPALRYEDLAEGVYSVISERSSRLSEAVERVSKRLGVKVVTKRVAVTPVCDLIESRALDLKEAEKLGLRIAEQLERAAKELGIDYVGGYAAFVDSGFSLGDLGVIQSIPEALSMTERVSSLVNTASTIHGINLDAVSMMGDVVKRTAELSGGRGCARLGVFANAISGIPFIPGAFHDSRESDPIINVAISGPGVVESVVKLAEERDLRVVHDSIKRAAFKITRLGELVGREVAKEMGVRFGSVDLSLAPTPAVGDSVAGVLKAMGVSDVGAPGSVLALAVLTDAVKKGGAMATSSVGGLSGAFIPVSEDSGMAEAVRRGSLSLQALMVMAAVCSTGLDMIPIAGDTDSSVISAIIGDVMALGVVLDKTLGVRLIPVPGAKEGDEVHFGGLLGSAPVLGVPKLGSERLLARGGVVPPMVNRLLKG
ncbi:MAG: PFL family protein [Candidatus Korarchaeum sp.]|nr:PFL family protein [Candidatus Korarchaeum sp.]MDW8036316.1 PFL family protein [Candidatus Korarchaeum sp.]